MCGDGFIKILKHLKAMTVVLNSFMKMFVN